MAQQVISALIPTACFRHDLFPFGSDDEPFTPARTLP
jgi:hypothetical protein